MIITGFFGVIVAILAILMMLGVVPMSPQLVGAGFLAVCLGMAGPFVVKTVP